MLLDLVIITNIWDDIPADLIYSFFGKFGISKGLLLNSSTFVISSLSNPTSSGFEY